MLPPISSRLHTLRSSRVISAVLTRMPPPSGGKLHQTGSPFLTSYSFSKGLSSTSDNHPKSSSLSSRPSHHHSSSCSCCSSASSPVTPVTSRRGISIYRPLQSQAGKESSPEPAAEEEASVAGDEDEEKSEKSSATDPSAKKGPVARHLDRDRSKVIPVETSIRYLKSSAYREAYGDNPVWVLYRRNFPGQFAPKATRKTCIRNHEITTGNPCPICRDVYLVVDYRNTELLRQFISPYTGEVLHWDKTGVCRRQQMNLQIEIERAKDYGTITFDVPFREYDWNEYHKIYDTYKTS